jgi:DNA-binding transcriptional LysR family regulator
VVDGLALLPAGQGVAGEDGALERGEGGAVDLQALGVDLGDELLVAGDHLGGADVAVRRGLRAGQAPEADAAAALEQDHPAHAVPDEHAAAGRAVPPPVAGAALVKHGDVVRGRRGERSAGKEAGPAVVCVDGGADPLGDRVPGRDDRKAASAPPGQVRAWPFSSR